MVAEGVTPILTLAVLDLVSPNINKPVFRVLICAVRVIYCYTYVVLSRILFLGHCHPGLHKSVGCCGQQAEVQSGHPSDSVGQVLSLSWTGQ